MTTNPTATPATERTTSHVSPRRPARLLLMGPPGAGKRTQGVSLAQQLQIPSLSPGELFRNLMTNDTVLAARLRDIVAYGGYVDDETTNAAVDRRLNSRDCRAGFLVYGYPRTVNQVQHLDQLLEQQQSQLDAVVYFEMGDDELVDRLLAREEQLARIDDRADTIRKRLALFHEQTEPLIDRYSTRGIVVTIDASGSFEQVAERISAALSQLGRSRSWDPVAPRSPVGARADDRPS